MGIYIYYINKIELHAFYDQISSRKYLLLWQLFDTHL